MTKAELVRSKLDVLFFCCKEIRKMAEDIDKLDDDEKPDFNTYKLVDAHNLIIEFLDDTALKLR